MTASIVLAIWATFGATEAHSTKAPPNFLIVLCDDLGYGDLGCFGSAIIKTPRLDKLAADGMRLTDCYASFPVCSPSRAGMMTGRNANRYGIVDWIPPNSGIYLPKSETTIATLLNSAGYATGHFGKWHLNSKTDGSEPTPGNHGFGRWLYTQNSAPHIDPNNFIREGKRTGKMTGHATTIVADEAMKFMTAAKGKPFFCNVWFHAPHEQVATPAEFSAPYAHYTPDEATYFGSVSLIDHEVGRLLDFLDTNGLRENTFVVFTSDNGPETLNRYKSATHSHGSPGPFRGMKLHVTEAGIRVPGIVRLPGRTKPGTVCREPINNTDFLPTLCDLAGVKISKDKPLDGASFTPIFVGKTISRTVPLWWRYDKAISTPWTRAIRDGKWKLLMDATGAKVALYDLEKDAAETRDLTDDNRSIVERLKAALLKCSG